MPRINPRLLLCSAVTLLFDPVTAAAQDSETSPYDHRTAEHAQEAQYEAAAGSSLPPQDTSLARCAAPAQQDAEEEAPETTFRVFWKDGLRLETDDGALKAQIGGRIEIDAAWLSTDRELRRALGGLRDGVEFRRAQLEVGGLLDNWLAYKAQFDFSTGAVGLDDVYLGFTKLPVVGMIRIGHTDQPFGLELRTSDRFTTFMERGLTSALQPGKDTGVLARNRAFGRLFFWAVGLFRDTDAQGRGTADGVYSLTGHASLLPWHDAEGRRLLHLGIAAMHHVPDRTVRLRARPEAHLSSVYYVDTGDIQADADDRIGLELAWVHGPFSLQGEYTVARVDLATQSPVFISAGYAFVSWFLTGESRSYDLGSATFDRPRPFTNFRGPGHGFGAWELAVRYSRIDLDDDGVRGGREADLTVGLNWHLNPSTKMSLNHTQAFVIQDGYDGNIRILQMRAQVDF